MARRAGDWVSLAGLRTDGRRPHEIRRLRCSLGTNPHADGSALLEQGQTQVKCGKSDPLPIHSHPHRPPPPPPNKKVLAIIHGPHEVTRRADAQHDRALVECEFHNTPFSGFDRKKRRPTDRASLEASLALKQTFEAAIMRHLYPRTQIDIQVYVMQTDGSALPAAINAVSLALVDAGIAMQEMVAACSVALLDDQTVLDVNYKVRVCWKGWPGEGGGELKAAA